MDLQPLDKLIIHGYDRRINARVIGMKTESDGSIGYLLEPLRVDFTRHKNGGRLLRVNSKDIENQRIKLEKHIV